MGILINNANNQDIDGLLWGWAWQWNTPTNHARLTYSFPTSSAVYLNQGYGEIRSFEAFNAQQIAASKKALANFDAVCNVDFVYTADPALGNIRLAEATYFDLGNGYSKITNETGFGLAPDNFAVPLFAHGDTWFNHTSYNAPALGSFAYASGILHEIGHALGLKHGHELQPVWDANGNVLHTNPVLPANHNSLEYSVMTYRGYVGAPDSPNVSAVECPSTLMQDDILALQWLYGANYSYNAGNTVYMWSPTTGATFINGVSQGTTFHHKIFMTVWDGGGVDTYNFSNYGSNAVISLAPGGWSTPWQAQRADLDGFHPHTHLARGSIANAQVFSGDLHGLIENAIGGRGNDKIYGNSLNNLLNGLSGNDLLSGVAGNDKLAGGPGNDQAVGGPGNDLLWGGVGKDTLAGGAGFDRFDFNALSESRGAYYDVITDFTHAQRDKIDLSTIDANTRGGGNQAFHFIGAHAYTHHAGELRYAGHVLQGDVNGDAQSDFWIVVNAASLLGSDFIL